MSLRVVLVLMATGLMGACATPYSPPVAVRGSAPFLGLAAIVEQAQGQPVDVLYVHGMCSHSEADVLGTIEALAGAIGGRIAAAAGQLRVQAVPGTDIELITVPAQIGTAQLHFTALRWSPLTTPLKRQLDFDKTASPTDCATAGECKPQRARLNGALKDGLLNDCLADALIYQGQSGDAMRRQMKLAIAHAAGRLLPTPVEPPSSLTLISHSLGSKLVFDALADMAAQGPASAEARVAAQLGQHLDQIFMVSNQLPLLGLADQIIAAPGRSASAPAVAPAPDSLTRLLGLWQGDRAGKRTRTPIAVVALTDPNDLLSYTLQASRYASDQVRVADVLVSNKQTLLGVLQRPDTTHTGYLANPDVIEVIACGRPRSALCK